MKHFLFCERKGETFPVSDVDFIFKSCFLAGCLVCSFMESNSFDRFCFFLDPSFAFLEKRREYSFAFLGKKRKEYCEFGGERLQLCERLLPGVGFNVPKGGSSRRIKAKGSSNFVSLWVSSEPYHFTAKAGPGPGVWRQLMRRGCS